MNTKNLDYAASSQQGGIVKMYKLLGKELTTAIEELSRALAT